MSGRGIDHVGIATRDLDSLAAKWERLGFTLTPRAYHQDHMGTSNRLVQFEGGNFIDVRFGPTTRWDPANGGLLLGDYHLQTGSPAINAGQRDNSIDDDYNDEPRPDPDSRCTGGNPNNRGRNCVDIGADEVQNP